MYKQFVKCDETYSYFSGVYVHVSHPFTPKVNDKGGSKF